MGDQAATVVILPVAIRTAWQLDLNPRSFAMMIALAASCSLLTPLEPACLLVYGPGHYRFLDYVKVGIVPVVLIFCDCCHFGSYALAAQVSYREYRLCLCALRKFRKQRPDG